MFGDRNSIRQVFFDAWKNRDNVAILSPLEKQLIAIIQQHPEYHATLENPESAMTQDFQTDNNPFLHLSLHLSLHEQLSTNRPDGINPIYQKLCRAMDQHTAEHKMMGVMANMLWEAGQNNAVPDEKNYLLQLKKL